MIRRIVIGDIHGCNKTLKALLEDEIKPSKDDMIFCVGDLIDRGPGSRDVIDYIVNLRREGYHIFPIRGNHEDMFLKTWEDKSYMRGWYANGAEETLRSFHIPDYMIYNYECLRLIPDNYISFLESLPYFYDLDDYFIVHAGLNFQAENILADTESMLWIRVMDYKADKIGNKTLVHGHTPIPLSIIKSYINRLDHKILNIDAGCVYKEVPGYGILIAIDLDTRALYIKENIDMDYVPR